MLKIVASELFTSTTSRKLLTEQNKKKTVTECNRSLPYFLLQISVADPGFLRGGGANSLTYNFPKISQKLHGIERIWTLGGMRIPRTPTRSATEFKRSSTHKKKYFDVFEVIYIYNIIVKISAQTEILPILH